MSYIRAFSQNWASLTYIIQSVVRNISLWSCFGFSTSMSRNLSGEILISAHIFTWCRWTFLQYGLFWRLRKTAAKDCSLDPPKRSARAIPGSARPQPTWDVAKNIEYGVKEGASLHEIYYYRADFTCLPHFSFCVTSFSWSWPLPVVWLTGCPPAPSCCLFSPSPSRSLLKR